MTLLEEAIVLATRKHAGQERRWGGAYILHPLAVCNMLASAGYDETYQIVAVLHDVLEDTQTTKEELSVFGDRVVHAVDLLTRREGQPEEDYVNGILTDKVAAIVKSADKVHNLWDAVYCAPCGENRTEEQETFAKSYVRKAARFYEKKFNSVLDDAINNAKQALSRTSVPDWKLLARNGSSFKLYCEFTSYVPRAKPEKYSYYHIKDLECFARGVNFDNEIYKDGKWEPDINNLVSDRLMGYDPSEDDDSPYKIGNTEIMEEIEEITEQEFMKMIGKKNEDN